MKSKITNNQTLKTNDQVILRYPCSSVILLFSKSKLMNILYKKKVKNIHQILFILSKSIARTSLRHKRSLGFVICQLLVSVWMAFKFLVISCIKLQITSFPFFFGNYFAAREILQRNNELQIWRRLSILRNWLNLERFSN